MLRSYARALLAGLVIAGGASRPAKAEFVIWAARIAEGDLWILGEVDEPNATVTLDDSFVEKTDSRGQFQFRIAYHPATCTVILKTETQSRAAVVANCGQRGPAGPSGPVGPVGPAAPVPEPAAPAAVSAQPTPPAPAPPSPAEPNPAQPVACSPKAALYQGEKGFEMWVTRKGRSSGQNPLKPGAGEAALVLQVAIAGKVASAYGPDYATMLRGGPPQQLEETTGPVAWDPKIDGLPETIQIVSETGPEVLARLRFKQCGDPPKPAPQVKRAAPTRRPAASGAASQRPGAAPPLARPVPQGAIPE